MAGRTVDVVLMAIGSRVSLIHMPVYGQPGDLAIVKFDGEGILFGEKRFLESKLIANEDRLARCRTANGVASAVIGKRIR